jgi:hypothetical protein
MCQRYTDSVPLAPMVYAESFIAGDQLGESDLWYIFWAEHPRLLSWDEEAHKYVNKHPAWSDPHVTNRAAQFIIDIAQLRHHAGRKFLAYGEMMKPLTFKNDLPCIEGWWQQAGPGPEIKRLPAVMHSVWKAPDGTLGLVFANISNREQKVRFDMDLAAYGLPGASSYRLTELAKDGAAKLRRTTRENSLSMELALPALSGYILEIGAE